LSLFCFFSSAPKPDFEVSGPFTHFPSAVPLPRHPLFQGGGMLKTVFSTLFFTFPPFVCPDLREEWLPLTAKKSQFFFVLLALTFVSRRDFAFFNFPVNPH